MEHDIRHLAPGDIEMMRQLLRMFGEAFGDPETYIARQPGEDYLRRLLERDSFIALAAVKDGVITGGLAAYVLHKFEQERSEIYIYDLAVAEGHRRCGIATALIMALRTRASELGAWVMFVQADTDEDDQPAIELYSKLGERESVLHFDIAVPEAVAGRGENDGSRA